MDKAAGKVSSFSVARVEDSLGFRLWQTTTVWQRQIKASLLEFKLNHTQFVIMANALWCQEHDIEVTQTLLVERTKLDKMNVSKTVAQLCQRGLVKRREHPLDTRAKLVLLTTKGAELARMAVSAVEAVDQQFFLKIKKQQGDLLHLLSLLVDGDYFPPP